MSVLILSPFFYPELISTGNYNTVLAQALVARGQKVTVFASHPLYPEWRPRIVTSTLPGVEIVRGGAWLRYPRSGIVRRAMLELWYALYAFQRYLRLQPRPECVVPIFPPSFFYWPLSHLVRGAKSIGIVHDLQGVYAKRSSSRGGRLLQMAIHWVESRSFEHCDRLIFLSQVMADRAIAEYGLQRSRCVVCYPFVAPMVEFHKTGDTLAAILPAGCINVVYSGALGDKQNPDGLFEFMASLAARKQDIRCTIFSGGPHFERLKVRAAETQSCNVFFRDLVPTERLGEMYARCDIQIVPQADGTADGSLPSKLPNLMAAGVPIFAICDEQSELAVLVRKACAGEVALSWATTELHARFDALLAAIAAESRAERVARQRSFVRERFSVDAVVEAILSD